MTENNREHFARKHPPGIKADPRIAEALKHKAKGNEISCAAAFSISHDLEVPPGEVGLAVDLSGIRLAKCQMGLFGYRPEKSVVKPAKTVSKEMEQAIRQELVKGKLPCRQAWDIAERFGIPKMKVASACETLGLKISSCQLGAF